jgi:hypothetical protein
LVIAAVYLLTAAVVAGTILVLWHLRANEAGSRPPLIAGLGHAAPGAAGLAVLLLALQGPPRGAASGAGSFGAAAAWLFGAALLTGTVILLRRRKAQGVIMAIHCGIAITGYVLLLAWDALG